jgi:hypothetical protein
MSSARFLRIASVISFLFAAGHTLGGRQSWTFTGETEVLHAMRTFRIQEFGVSRTYMDFYRGFGFTLSVYLLLQAVVLWQLAKIADTNPAQARPIVVSFTLASVANIILSWTFIFAVPAIFGIAITACLAAALFTARPRAPQPSSNVERARELSARA